MGPLFVAQVKILTNDNSLETKLNVQIIEVVRIGKVSLYSRMQTVIS